jgi:accessory gene regulator protein AgrB
MKDLYKKFRNMRGGYKLLLIAIIATIILSSINVITGQVLGIIIMVLSIIGITYHFTKRSQ